MELDLLSLTKTLAAFPHCTTKPSTAHTKSDGILAQPSSSSIAISTLA